MTDWTVTLEDAPDAGMRDAVLRPLIAHNEAQAGTGGYSLLAITVRDPAGGIAGGLWGYIWHGYLFVELLAMGEARGEGLGTRVMALAEAEARRRGCVGMWLDTFTFQAPGFYAKLGFNEFGRMCEYPAGHDRLFLIKRFGPPH